MKTNLKTPDITKNQMIALVAGLIGVLASMGVPLSEANTNRAYGAAVAIPTVLMLADAIIRFGRAMMAGKQAELLTREDLGLDEADED